MIYRVDYVLAVILAGGFVGALLARQTSQIEAARLARGYYALIAVRVVLGAIFLHLQHRSSQQTNLEHYREYNGRFQQLPPWRAAWLIGLPLKAIRSPA